MGWLFLFLLSAREKWMDGTIRNTGAEGLLEILCCGLERDAEQRTANRLGDRSRYVGFSDIEDAGLPTGGTGCQALHN